MPNAEVQGSVVCSPCCGDTGRLEPRSSPTNLQNRQTSGSEAWYQPRGSSFTFVPALVHQFVEGKCYILCGLAAFRLTQLGLMESFRYIIIIIDIYTLNFFLNLFLFCSFILSFLFVLFSFVFFVYFLVFVFVFAFCLVLYTVLITSFVYFWLPAKTQKYTIQEMPCVRKANGASVEVLSHVLGLVVGSGAWLQGP